MSDDHNRHRARFAATTDAYISVILDRLTVMADSDPDTRERMAVATEHFMAERPEIFRPRRILPPLPMPEEKS